MSPQGRATCENAPTSRWHRTWGGRVSRGPDDQFGPDPTADQFEAIVAGWRREGAVPMWPSDDRPPTEPPRTPTTPMPPVPPARPVPAEADDRLDHFVPPEPP